MIVIPAIDLRGGQCVRLHQGDYGRETVFGLDPVAYARRWASEGAERLHVVDLDGAREGSPNPRHWEIVRTIVSAAPIPVQLGGGIRDLETARGALSLGVDRVIVGTAIASDDTAASTLFDQLGEQVIAGIDARQGLVAVHGWTDTSGHCATDFARRMVRLGARRIVYTDIARDGTQDGPNLASLRDVAEAAGVAVIASGGIGNARHIRDLAAQAPRNVEAVIVGRALYSGSLTLSEAMEAAHA